VKSIDQPVRVIGQAKSALRAAGIKVKLAMVPVRDAEGVIHDTLVRRVAR